MTPSVLFVSVPTGVGGSTRSLANLLGYLAGCAVRVLAGPADGRFVRLVRDAGSVEEHLPVISSRPPRPPRRLLSAARILAYVVRHRRELAAVHANGLKELSMCLPAVLVARVPLVVWVHNFRLPPSVRLLGWLWRLLLPLCTVRWAAVSPLARDLVVEPGLARPQDVTIVPNPIDPADVLVTDAVRRAAPPRDGRVTVAFLGSPRAYKGFHTLPATVEAVDPALDVHWLVFSHQADDHLAEVWDRLRAAEASGRVSIRGKVTDVRLAYAQCDVVVCPSVLDSFCRVAAEAMVNGIPVVGSDLPPIRELLGDDEAGLVVPVKDPRAVAAAVERLVRDPQLRARLGAAGRERSAAYGPATVRTAFLELYGLPEPARVRAAS